MAAELEIAKVSVLMSSMSMNVGQEKHGWQQSL